MALTQSLLLHLHPADYHQLLAAAEHSGQDIGDLIRLAIHRETCAILARAQVTQPDRTAKHYRLRSRGGMLEREANMQSPGADGLDFAA